MSNYCEWCNCEIRDYDKHNPVSMHYLNGKRIFLHQMCKKTYFDYNNQGKILSDMSASGSAYGLSGYSRIIHHLHSSMTG